MNRETALFRSKLNREVRSFFEEKDFLEVETPLLTPAPIPEAHIELFSTRYYSDTLGERELYLIPSPEVHMKRLIAEGSGSIFQICRSFRNDEQMSRHHNPEFTMLEWYTVPGTSEENIRLTEELFLHLAGQFPETGGNEALRPPFRRMSMADAFGRYAGIDLEAAMDLPRLRRAASEAGVEPREKGEGWEDLFHRIFLSLVEPELPADKPLVLERYPAAVDALARRIPGTPWRDRWELYVKGIEAANCYGEETDPGRVDAFFRSEYARKAQSARVIPDIDTAYSALFEDFPACSGVALGMDRLAMLFSDSPSIGGVIFFPFSDMLP
jgi:lysyl-tRNA synthetase class 2